jgi:DNA/RNA endonuclease YhcR with UshA esterase domain
MKKTKFLTLAAGIVAGMLALAALADDTNEVTMTGMMVCGKCKLHITSKCQNVLQVENDGTNVNYFLTQNQVSKDFHSNICTTDGEKATVTGTVKEKHGKEMLTASKIVASADATQ